MKASAARPVRQRAAANRSRWDQMSKMLDRQKRRLKRKTRVRKKVFGTSEKPRLSVAKTLNNIFAQVIDDDNDGKSITLVAASSMSKEIRDKLENKSKTEKAALVGEEIAKKSLAKGISRIAFDRNGILYHGRIRALAEAARKSGLDF